MCIGMNTEQTFIDFITMHYKQRTKIIGRYDISRAFHLENIKDYIIIKKKESKSWYEINKTIKWIK